MGGEGNGQNRREEKRREEEGRGGEGRELKTDGVITEKEKKEMLTREDKKEKRSVTVSVLFLSLVYLTLTFSTTATFFTSERGVLFDRTVFLLCNILKK